MFLIKSYKNATSASPAFIKISVSLLYGNGIYKPSFLKYKVISNILQHITYIFRFHLETDVYYFRLIAELGGRLSDPSIHVMKENIYMQENTYILRNGVE